MQLAEISNFNNVLWLFISTKFNIRFEALWQLFYEHFRKFEKPVTQLRQFENLWKIRCHQNFNYEFRSLKSYIYFIEVGEEY